MTSGASRIMQTLAKPQVKRAVVVVVGNLYQEIQLPQYVKIRLGGMVSSLDINIDIGVGY